MRGFSTGQFRERDKILDSPFLLLGWSPEEKHHILGCARGQAKSGANSGNSAGQALVNLLSKD